MAQFLYWSETCILNFYIIQTSYCSQLPHWMNWLLALNIRLSVFEIMCCNFGAGCLAVGQNAAKTAKHNLEEYVIPRLYIRSMHLHMEQLHESFSKKIYSLICGTQIYYIGCGTRRGAKWFLAKMQVLYCRARRTVGQKFVSCQTWYDLQVHWASCDKKLTWYNFGINIRLLTIISSIVANKTLDGSGEVRNVKRN